MTNPKEVKDKFYNYVNDVISATPSTDKLIILGYFRARIGSDHQSWEGVIGPEGVGKCNSNDLLLLRRCAEHDILITNKSSVYLIETKHPMHPHSRTLVHVSHYRLCHIAENRYGGCLSDKVCVLC